MQEFRVVDWSEQMDWLTLQVAGQVDEYRRVGPAADKESYALIEWRVGKAPILNPGLFTYGAAHPDLSIVRDVIIVAILELNRHLAGESGHVSRVEFRRVASEIRAA
jgi:hypothetical protein